MTEFGSGPYLDENFDFSVSRTGDIRTVSGAAELEKDLAVQMAVNLSTYIGQVPTPNMRSEALSTARRLALADARIEQVDVNRSSIEWSDDSKRITVQLFVIAGDDQYELVFDI